MAEMRESAKPSRIWATVNGARSVFPGGENYLIGGWESQPREYGTEYVRADIADDMLEALTNLVSKFEEMNPMRTADFHSNCGCLRCKFDAAKAALSRAEGRA